MITTTNKHQATAAKQFVKNWKGKGYEKGESQKFWLDLLCNVFGVQDFAYFISFEDRVKLDHTAFIDGYIDSTKVLIEQKSIEKDLRAPIKQSDGSNLTPFQQAKRYITELPVSRHPRWVVTCNFRSFLVYDMERPDGEPFEILLENLDKEYFRLSFLTDMGNVHLQKEMEVSIKAGELVGKIYDALLARYKDATSEETLKSLNVLCVRLVFCLYAEDAGVFGVRNMFHDYMARFEARDFRRALIDLFKVLDTKMSDRDPYLDDDLAAFPYVNGGLFTQADIEIPQFTDELRTLILSKASDDFDWSEISPTIFGAVFESTLNPDTRRSGGMHYTSIENIHKVIDPLFLNDLRNELEEIKSEKVGKAQDKKAAEFQNKLAALRFLDPACGSGNFLTETYLSLRRLENEAIRIQTKGQSRLGFEETNPVKMSIHQFYGIEINDFAVAVATTALWIAESQMLKETETIVDFDLDMLPLKAYHNIKEGNALRLSWSEWEIEKEKNIVIAEKTNVYPIKEIPPMVACEPVVRYGEIDLYSAEVRISPENQTIETYHVDFDYIMGNPPFVGYALQSAEQKQDLIDLFGKKWKNAGKLDYVSGWYLKAARLIANSPNTHAALVSTNSITQGEQVANLWRPLFEHYGIHIDFAYRTFRWDSEATMKAHVHCVVVGFSRDDNDKTKVIYTESGDSQTAKNISPYLIDAPNVWIESRKNPICEIPEMQKGSIPVDDGNLIIEEKDYSSFIKEEPQAVPFIRPLLGAEEFIKNTKRYCLWLVDASPADLRKCPKVLKRIQNVREFRLKSSKEATRKYADFPTRFMEIRQPDSDYLLIPSTTSENRRYIPIGYINKDVVTTNANFTVPNATLYHFGILTSNVHMAWMRAVCGRLKSDYRYSKDIVYNNFPWCAPTDTQKLKIEQTAQAILEARAKYPESSLADLYDETTMPPELRKAHQENDRAVMQAYGFPVKISENEVVSELFKLYETLAK